MSIQKSEEYYQKFTKNQLKNAVVPFSQIFRTYKRSDIYSGNEKIPFNDRDPEYKMIFRQEFANILNEEFKIFRPVVRFPSF